MSIKSMLSTLCDIPVNSFVLADVFKHKVIIIIIIIIIIITFIVIIIIIIIIILITFRSPLKTIIMIINN